MITAGLSDTQYINLICYLCIYKLAHNHSRLLSHSISKLVRRLIEARQIHYAKAITVER